MVLISKSSGWIKNKCWMMGLFEQKVISSFSSVLLGSCLSVQLVWLVLRIPGLAKAAFCNLCVIYMKYKCAACNFFISNHVEQIRIASNI